MATNFGDYEPVIGLEVHAQLLTRTKLFCGCRTSFGDPPNTHTCPVCLGLPGALPALNEEAVRMAIAAALALGCTIQSTSIFARKNYFYPDLPKGYQISQYDLPLAVRGRIEIESSIGKTGVGITRVHIEEDAGKNLHGVGGDSIVDLNRAGTPLIEIVGEPDLRAPADAAEYLKRLRETLMFIGVNDGNLEQGSFRCDANVSVRKKGQTAYGTRVELKNINSFRFVADAIEIEVRRQIAIIDRGERVRQQTRGYNAERRETYLLRDKENEAGYRYFPEPDLPPLVLDEALVEAVRGALPRLPVERRRYLIEEQKLTPYAAGVLTSHPKIAAFFDEASRHYKDPVALSNFIQTEVMRDVRTSGLEANFPITPERLAAILRFVDEGTISSKQAKELYTAVVETNQDPAAIVRERGMAVLSDEGAIEAIARPLLEANPKQVAAYRGGKTNMLGFFVGQIMKQTGGSASPAVVNTVLKRLLDNPAPAVDAGAAEGNKSAAEASKSASKKASEEAKTSAQSSSVASITAQSLLAQSPLLAPSSTIGEDVAPSPLAQSVVPTAPTLTSADRLNAPVARPTPASVPIPVTIPFDSFTRIDLRVGVIVTASRVPKKDKLLDLRVDTGDEDGPRRIVAGLALSFAPEELIGRRVIVACNLEPRTFAKDLVSYGMILAAGPSDALALATVSKDVPVGTRIK